MRHPIKRKRGGGGGKTSAGGGKGRENIPVRSPRVPAADSDCRATKKGGRKKKTWEKRPSPRYGLTKKKKKKKNHSCKKRERDNTRLAASSVPPPAKKEEKKGGRRWRKKRKGGGRPSDVHRSTVGSISFPPFPAAQPGRRGRGEGKNRKRRRGRRGQNGISARGGGWSPFPRVTARAVGGRGEKGVEEKKKGGKKKGGEEKGGPVNHRQSLMSRRAGETSTRSQGGGRKKKKSAKRRGGGGKKEKRGKRGLCSVCIVTFFFRAPAHAHDEQWPGKKREKKGRKKKGKEAIALSSMGLVPHEKKVLPITIKEEEKEKKKKGGGKKHGAKPSARIAMLRIYDKKEGKKKSAKGKKERGRGRSTLVGAFTLAQGKHGGGGGEGGKNPKEKEKKRMNPHAPRCTNAGKRLTPKKGGAGGRRGLLRKRGRGRKKRGKKLVR